MTEFVSFLVRLNFVIFLQLETKVLANKIISIIKESPFWTRKCLVTARRFTNRNKKRIIF